MERNILRVLHGTSQSIISMGSINIPCYILEEFVRVFNSAAIGTAMGNGGKSDLWLFEFLLHISRFVKIPIDFMDSVNSGILFYDEHNIIQKGITPDQLLEACKYISSANKSGFLYLSELRFAKAAEIIIEHSNNIQEKIDLASGYERYKNNRKDLIARHLMKITNNQALYWTKTFSDVFFEEIFKFYNLTWNDSIKNPTAPASLIYDLIFARIGEDLMEELRNTKPKMKYSKQDVPEKYLEHPKLQAQMHATIALLKASGESDTIFTQLLDKTFPKVAANEVFWTQKELQNPIDYPHLVQFNDALETALRHHQSKKSKNN